MQPKETLLYDPVKSFGLFQVCKALCSRKLSSAWSGTNLNRKEEKCEGKSHSDGKLLKKH